MSPLNRLRLLATVLSLAALVSRPLAENRMPTMLADLGPMFVPLAIFFLAALPQRRRPATFAVRNGLFIAEPSPFAGVSMIIVGWLASPLVMETLRNPVSITIAAIWFAAGQLLYLPKITLTPEMLVIRGWGVRRIPWESLAPDHPRDPDRVLELWLWTTTGRWAMTLIRRGARHIDDVFLAQAIRHYVAHPEARPAIGTEAGLIQLKEAIAGRANAAGRRRPRKQPRDLTATPTAETRRAPAAKASSLA